MYVMCLTQIAKKKSNIAIFDIAVQNVRHTRACCPTPEQNQRSSTLERDRLASREWLPSSSGLFRKSSGSRIVLLAKRCRRGCGGGSSSGASAAGGRHSSPPAAAEAAGSRAQVFAAPGPRHHGGAAGPRGILGDDGGGGGRRRAAVLLLRHGQGSAPGPVCVVRVDASATGLQACMGTQLEQASRAESQRRTHLRGCMH